MARLGTAVDAGFGTAAGASAMMHILTENTAARIALLAALCFAALC